MRLLAARESSRIATLDGLRAIAIVLVMLYHYTVHADPNLGIQALLFKIGTLGWSGVDLFFVLSGFLITAKLLEARDEEHRFRNFYARRALRIFPLYYAVLIVVFAIGMPPFRHTLPYWLYYSNFAQPTLPTDSFVRLGHFWSLAIEEQFYLVWPAIIFFCRRRTSIAICIAVAVAAPLLRFALASYGFPWTATYGWTPLRADGLVLGALIALAGRSRRLAWLGIALTGPFLLWVMWRTKSEVIVKTLTDPAAIALRTLLPSAVAIFFAGVVILVIEHQPRILAWRPLQPIARYSYGMYVAHFMILPALTALLPLQTLSANRGALLLFVTGSIASFVLAAISYHGFEAIFLRAQDRFRDTRSR